MLRRLAFAAAVGLARSAEAGGVTVEATWLTEATVGAVDADLTAYPPGKYVLIELTLDTHSGDLNEIDLQREAALKQDGLTLEPETWLSLSDDSHHREGVLVFPLNGESGPADLTLSLGDDEEVALVWESPPAT